MREYKSFKMKYCRKSDENKNGTSYFKINVFQIILNKK